jgi:hypothetical protein
MNERIKELAEQAGYKHSPTVRLAFSGFDKEKFAELIIKDIINIHNQEWYGWNNAPKVENETPRDIGMRVGAKSQTIRLIHLIKKHFGVKDDYED